MKLDFIELEHLTVSSANMRAKQKDRDIAAILPSVRARGVLVPLLVRPNGEPDRYEIVAGRRRFLAAKVVAEEKGESIALPCCIMEAGDDATAVEASLIENFDRLNPDEVTQWETFSWLIREGRSIEDIAGTFGLAERLVRRILALGNLLPRIRTLYRKEFIDAGTVRQLTLATKAQQRDWLTLYDSPDAYAPTGRALKEWLFGGEAVLTKVALFDLADYPAPIVSDLFGEDSYFADSGAFWALQRQVIEARRQGYLDDGWSAVELLEPGSYFQQWEYEKRSKTKGGRVYIAMSPGGEAAFHEGYLPRKEVERAERSTDRKAAARPELTNPLRVYVNLHRHAAVRAELLRHPAIALRLVVAHAIAGTALWNVRAEPRQADRPGTIESVNASISSNVFDDRRRETLAVLGLERDALTLFDAAQSVSDLFQVFLGRSDEEILSVVSIMMGETLQAGSDIVDEVGTMLQVDMAELWHADEAFFELVRDRAVLKKLVAEVAGPEVSAANANEKGAVLKTIIRDTLAGQNGRQRLDAWAPRWLRFPAESNEGPRPTPIQPSEEQTE